MESQPHKVTVPVSSAVGKKLRARQTDRQTQTDRLTDAERQRGRSDRQNHTEN